MHVRFGGRLYINKIAFLVGIFYLFLSTLEKVIAQYREQARFYF